MGLCAVGIGTICVFGKATGEVLLHVAAANYNLPELIGTLPPDGFQVKDTKYRRHSAEHISQLISYAPMKGIAPPWSEPGETAKKS